MCKLKTLAADRGQRQIDDGSNGYNEVTKTTTDVGKIKKNNALENSVNEFEAKEQDRDVDIDSSKEFTVNEGPLLENPEEKEVKCMCMLFMIINDDLAHIF